MTLLSPQEFLWENFPRRAAEIEQIGLLDEFEELTLEYIEHYEAAAGRLRDLNGTEPYTTKKHEHPR